MATPSSGQIKISEIINEIGLRPLTISFRNLSDIAGFSVPDKFSDFYSYSQTDVQRYKNAVTNTGYSLGGAEVSAINTLFSDLNSYGVYSKIYAFYPMIGNGGDSQKLNAKSEGGIRKWQYDLIFGTGWSFDADGAKGDGTSDSTWTAKYSYPATTNLKTSHFGTYTTHQGINSRGWDIGVFDEDNNYPYAFMAMYDDGYQAAIYDYDFSDGVVTSGPYNFEGSSMMSYDASNNFKRIYQNEDQYEYRTTAISDYSRSTVVIGGYDYQNNRYTDNQFGFITFGQTLTSLEMEKYQLAINDFQTTLGRNVY